MMRVGNDGALTYAYSAQAATSEDGLIIAVALTTSVADAPQAVRWSLRLRRWRVGAWLRPDGQGAAAV